MSDTIKGSKMGRDVLDTTYTITKLIKKSPKWDAKLQNLKQCTQVEELESDNSPTITLLCPLR